MKWTVRSHTLIEYKIYISTGKMGKMGKPGKPGMMGKTDKTENDWSLCSGLL